MNPYIQILRPHNCLIAAVAVVLGIMIAGGGIPLELTLLAAAVAFLVCGGGNVINDYYDYDIDRVNRPERPLPSGRMGLRTAHYYGLGLFLSGVAISAVINLPALLLAGFNSLLLYAYGSRIKKAGGLLKNFVVSYLVASPFLFGGIVGMGNLAAVLVFAICAFLVNTAREILKDIEDYEGDRGHVVTLPMRMGLNQAFFIAGFFAVTAVVISPLPGILGLVKNRGVYLALILLTDALIFHPFLTTKKANPENARKGQATLKKGMAMALVAFFFGTV
ncbi:MAG: UbiA family prenyltransferase [Euryarchaeota archaeon]|nr:UbiA family prenyltransferase [Euryarchaeota archaeon]